MSEISTPNVEGQLGMTKKIEMTDLFQMSPLFITTFMIMTSIFNGDIKAFLWLVFILVGVGTIAISLKPEENCKNALLPLFANFKYLSVSTFFIVYTMVYMMAPMFNTNDWNYFVIVGFLSILGMDTITKFNFLPNCTSKLGIVWGVLIGTLYAIICYLAIHLSGGDKFLYFNTISSNNVYCSKPKKQQFKCYVYKNGEIISAL
jgi:hypothetical protein